MIRVGIEFRSLFFSVASAKKVKRMESLGTYIIAFILSLSVTLLSIPLVKKLAYRFGVVSVPDERKVHTKPMPEAGGLSIVFGFLAGFLYLWPTFEHAVPILIGGLVIALVGLIDDKYSLPPLVKLLGQIIAAVIVVQSGMLIDFVNIPFVGYHEFSWWLSYPLTIFWIVVVMNAINLIDGLDGLASGVSSIALTSMLVMAVFQFQTPLAIALCVILLAGTIGFLFFNIHPAKIFMGDTGALFIGYVIALISITGLFKSLTLFSLILPVVILGVPIFDTVFAIIRRLVKGQKISTPDKFHLHHCLMALGFSHRATVNIIYLISICFAAAAIVLSKSVMWGSLLIICLLLIMMQFTAEMIGLWKNRKTPLINTVRKIVLISQTLKK